MNHLSNIGKGWHPFVQPLIDFCYLNDIEVVQVKEKFGTLRFYTKPWPVYGSYDVFSMLVQFAENESRHVCEHCGKPGTLRSDSWIKTLCNDCAEPWSRGERWPGME